MWQNRDLSKIVTNVSWWVCFRHRCDQAMFVMTWIFTLFNACRTLLISRSRYYSKKGVKKRVPVDSVLGVFFTPSF